MSCSIQLLFLIFNLISKSISLKAIFEDDFNELDQIKWEIISSENQCKSELESFIHFLLRSQAKFEKYPGKYV